MDPVDRVAVATEEQRELAGSGPVDRPGDRRVDDLDPGRCLVGQTTHQVAAVGREVDPDTSAAQCGQCAVLAAHHREHVIRTRQRGAEHVTPRGDFCSRCGTGGPGLDHVGERIVEQVEADDLVPGQHELLGHGVAHVAETDEADRQLLGLLRFFGHLRVLSCGSRCQSAEHGSPSAAARWSQGFGPGSRGGARDRIELVRDRPRDRIELVTGSTSCGTGRRSA